MKKEREQCCGRNFLPDKCPNETYARGLCRVCYECARVQVNQKRRTTWDKLVAAGLAKPPKVKYVRKSRFDPAAYLDDLEKAGGEGEGSDESVQLVR